MSEFVDYYAVLGLKRTATADEVKHAYREHAKTAHPDAGGTNEAMQLIHDAYSTLGEASARRHYDSQWAARQAPPVDVRRASEAVANLHRQPHLVQIRRASWAQFKIALGITLLLGLALPAGLAIAGSRDNQLLVLLFFGFLPMFATLLTGVFIISPQIRLNFRGIFKKRSSGQEDFLTLAIVLTGCFAGSLIWLSALGGLFK